MQTAIFTIFNSSANVNSEAVAISQELAYKLDLIEKQKISLQFGRSRYPAVIYINRYLTGDNIKINPSLMRKNGITNHLACMIINDNNILHVGPYIGVAANLHHSDPQKPFGIQSFFIKQLIEQARAKGAICFGFSPKDLNLSTHQIHGYTYRDNDWKEELYPLPDVIYPRCNAESNRPLLRQKLAKLGVQFFNPVGMGKWGTHNALIKNPKLAKYLPDTCLINNFSQLEQMLRKYRQIYLKPVSGSQGRNIIRISHGERHGAYEYQYQLEQRQINAQAASLRELENNLRIHMGGRRYLAQQQIDLLRSDGCIMDLRVMAQKDRAGEWLVTGKVFRIGPNGSITSNISRGGRVGDIGVILTQQFDPVTAQAIMEKTDFLSLETARTLEGTLGPIGEMGIDIGIDRNRRIWLIEVNLKPARKIFSLMKDYDTRIHSVERPIEYSIHLAGF